jgi:hypothetical protein
MNDDDRRFFDAFEATTLPLDRWTHRAHVKVAYLYLSAHPFDDALRRMREGVKAYNAAKGIPDKRFVGYNETTTRAFMHLVAAVMAAYGETFPTASADAFCDTHPQLLSRHVLRLFYSPGRRIHPDAKATFVEPDLAPLPRIAHMPAARVPEPDV